VSEKAGRGEDALNDSSPAMIRFQSPQLPPAEQIESYFAASRRSGWFSNGGRRARSFAKKLAEYVSADALAVPVASGTAGLLAAVAACFEKSAGTDVLLPSFTFAAVPAAVCLAGYQPVFVDVDPENWHLDPEQLRTALDERAETVAGVLACSTFGCPPPVSTRRLWESLTKEAEIPLVVDSAAGFGATDEAGRPLGGQGDAEVFSFHATKPFAIGEGGAVTMRDPHLRDEILRNINFGFDENRQVAPTLGFNGKMSELHAAAGLAVLDGFAEVLAARRSSAAQMAERLSACGLQLQSGGGERAWQMVPALAPSRGVRQDLLREAPRAAIELQSYYQPLHLQPAFSGAASVGSLPVTRDLGERMVCFPMANDLTSSDLGRIGDFVERMSCLPHPRE